MQGHNTLTKTNESLNITALCGSNSDWNHTYILRYVPELAFSVGEIYTTCFKISRTRLEQMKEQIRKGISHLPTVCASCTAVAMHTRARAARRGSAMALVADYWLPAPAESRKGD